MKPQRKMNVLERRRNFSTLDSGLRDETSPNGSSSLRNSHFSTLDSGLRDETSGSDPARPRSFFISVPSTRVYAMKPSWNSCRRNSLPISVPSTRVYAMKHPEAPRGRGRSRNFSTLDSGLRDETYVDRPGVRGGNDGFQYPRLGSTR